MFSSFSSFLPSVLQPNQEQRSHQSLATPQQETPEPSVTSDPGVSRPPDSRSKKKDKREKLVNETFIIVRPPPSKSNHPLNLQVQLVPPQSRHDRPHATLQALDSSAPDPPDPTASSTDLRRTSSSQSETSTFSGYNSVTSIASFNSSNSSSTTSSGRRMIIPLYNLQAHNVMTNVVVDAGTDAKVAKFAKRGLEIIGLAVLEPIEVWGAASLPGALPPSSSARTSVDDSHRELGLFPRVRTHSSTSRPVTPDCFTTAPALSTSSHTDARKPSVMVTPAIPEEALSINAQPQRGGAKKLFNKMFKKREASSRDIPVVVQTVAPEVQGLPSIPSSRQSQDIPPSNFQVVDVPGFVDNFPPTPLSGISSTATLCPPVLGIQPSLYPPISPPKGRPATYVWVVRKWLKGTDSGLLNGMMGRLSANGRGDVSGVSVPQVEVRFEWSRGRKKEKERGRKSRADRRSAAQGPENGNVSRRGSAVVISEPLLSRTIHRSPSRSRDRQSGLDAAPASHRQSRFSHHSTSSEASTSVGSCARRDDSGDDSEPEDSETPWTCTLTLQRTGHPPPMHSEEQREQVVRLKVATLSPTPHHPKVVGLLKVPFPLPDIEVDRLAVHRRVVTALGVSRTASNSGELILTAEEIKDSISTTAMWLVVREAFGGVGRERRKGDGWRIRA
ncbi:hypothetical protein AZE42_01336 [Rhizopogon vesiculosus]|uniref:Uncharacterized protein n=1 Tax=Rhizopogon vesiculosus TaxID=180088 RepID=A0A1J8QWP8_9AGAM|nr:hypothetical protein AZE42_01336 [Rhizopogon vesiculosus]